MGFYWKDKKDQLFARRGSLPPSDDTEQRKWTSFEMPLREPAPMPVAFDLTRFLASSITFMVHLRVVRVIVDGHAIIHLSKDPGIPSTLAIPRGLKISSPNKMMFVTAMTSTRGLCFFSSCPAQNVIYLYSPLHRSRCRPLCLPDWRA